MERWIDLVFLLYFGTHIPIALFADSQAIMPKWIYPQKCVEVMDWFITEYKDDMMGGKPAWFQAFIYCEICLQLPFMFVAFYAYWKGVSKCQWIRLPIIVYSSHVVTSLISIYSHMFLNDSSSNDVTNDVITPGPRTMEERVKLAAFYFPYFLVPIMLLVDSLFSSVYTCNVKKQSSGASSAGESRARSKKKQRTHYD